MVGIQFTANPGEEGNEVVRSRRWFVVTPSWRNVADRPSCERRAVFPESGSFYLESSHIETSDESRVRALAILQQKLATREERVVGALQQLLERAREQRPLKLWSQASISIKKVLG